MASMPAGTPTRTLCRGWSSSLRTRCGFSPAAGCTKCTTTRRWSLRQTSRSSAPACCQHVGGVLVQSIAARASLRQPEQLHGRTAVRFGRARHSIAAVDADIDSRADVSELEVAQRHPARARRPARRQPTVIGRSGGASFLAPPQSISVAILVRLASSTGFRALSCALPPLSARSPDFSLSRTKLSTNSKRYSCHNVNVSRRRRWWWGAEVERAARAGYRCASPMRSPHRVCALLPDRLTACKVGMAGQCRSRVAVARD